jgi:hypothetical protein
LSAGTHTIKIFTDAAGVIGESNESDNTYSKTITLQQLSTTYSMSGTIHSGSNTGPVLAGATVSIAGKTATSSSTGTFSITGIPAGTYTLSISKSGYNTYTNTSYYVGSNQSGLNFYLTQPTTTNNPPVAEAAVSKSSTGPYYGYNTPLTVTKGQSVSLYFFADMDVNGDGKASLDPDGWTNTTNGVSSGGKCEWNTDLNQGTPTFEKVISNPAAAGNCNIGPYTYTFNDAPGTYEYQMLRITDSKGAQSTVSKIRITVAAPTPIYEGWVDSADCNTISGWAWDKNQPNTPISVDIYNGSTKLATVTANIFRQDLVNAGKGNGYHGFSYATPSSLKDGNAHSIYVKYGGTSTNLSGSPKSIACGGTPTLLIDGGTSSTKSQGGTFVTTGVNYTPSVAVTRYLKQPNGTTITLTPTLYANSSGNISWSYTSICTTAIGTYYLWVKDNATGKTSNTVIQIVTASSSCNPTLLINGGTSSTKSQGGTFVTTGVNYTPSGAVIRYLKQPNGTTITLTPTLYANSSGNISWSYTSVCTTAPGTYYLWVKDNATGKTSNTVTQIVTKSSSCP